MNLCIHFTCSSCSQRTQTWTVGTGKWGPWWRKQAHSFCLPFVMTSIVVEIIVHCERVIVKLVFETPFFHPFNWNQTISKSQTKRCDNVSFPLAFENDNNKKEEYSVSLESQFTTATATTAVDVLVLSTAPKIHINSSAHTNRPT